MSGTLYLVNEELDIVSTVLVAFLAVEVVDVVALFLHLGFMLLHSLD